MLELRVFSRRGDVLARLGNRTHFHHRPQKLALLLCLAAATVAAQGKKAENVPEIKFDSVPNFLKLPPNLYMGEGIGVASNSKGHIFVYTRSQATRLFEFDATGNYVREIGQGLYGFAFAHAVREALRAPYVVQERVKPVHTVFPLMSYGHLEFKEMQVDVQPQAFLGKVAGCSSYVSSAGAGTYSPASGIAPTFIIDPKN